MKLTLTGTQFCQIMMCIIYDQLLHPDKTVPILKDQDYNDLMTLFKNRSMKTILLQYYMRLDPLMRIRYRMMRDVFYDNNKTADVYIEIRKEHMPPDTKGKKGFLRKTGDFLAKIITMGAM